MKNKHDDLFSSTAKHGKDHVLAILQPIYTTGKASIAENKQKLLCWEKSLGPTLGCIWTERQIEAKLS